MSDETTMPDAPVHAGADAPADAGTDAPPQAPADREPVAASDDGPRPAEPVSESSGMIDPESLVSAGAAP